MKRPDAEDIRQLLAQLPIPKDANDAQAIQQTLIALDHPKGGTMRKWFEDRHGHVIETYQWMLGAKGLRSPWIPGPRVADASPRSYVKLSGSAREYLGCHVVAVAEDRLTVSASWGRAFQIITFVDRTPTAPSSSQERSTEDVDVQARDTYRADVERLEAGEDAQLGYLLIDRQWSQDVAIVYPSQERAELALEDDEDDLVNGLCEEDCLDAYVPETMSLEDLTDREVILALTHAEGA